MKYTYREDEINLSGREDGMTGRTFLDNLRYCLKHSNRTELLVLVKACKKKASAGLSAPPVFLGTVSAKDTPSGRTLQCLRSRDAKAEIRSGQVNANRVTNFTEIVLRDSVLFFPKEIMYLIIPQTFQAWEYLGFGGRLLRAHLRSLRT